MLAESLRVPQKVRRMRIVMLLLALVLTGSVATFNAEPAHAAGNVPWDGALCNAMENIQFWNDQGQTSYTVQQGDAIRVDDYFGYETPVALGHGNGHSTRWFYWRHTNGTFRIENCR